MGSMKALIQMIAEELHKDDKAKSFLPAKRREYNDLPFHAKLTYECEAERVIRVLRCVRRRRKEEQK